MASHSHHNLSIIEAVETLSSIADLEFDREIGIAQKHEVMLGDEKIAYKTVHWLNKEDTPATVNLVRETFRVILHYLRQFYKNEYGQVTDVEIIERIKTIMVLVGEAAKKLDKYTHFFHQSQSVTDFKEYKQLQEFYQSKIARKIEEGGISQWISGLPLEQRVSEGVILKAPPRAEKGLDSKHVFVDFESVKRDSEYELFFIHKEDGSRFFSPRLLRNVKLICDFGGYFGERKGLDPLDCIQEWHDRLAHTYARQIVKGLGQRLNHYFRQLSSVKHHEMVELLNKAFLALMMSSHANNLLRHHPVKSCAEYFSDFQKFLREALQANIYQRWLVYPPKEDNQFAVDLMEIVQSVCRILFTQLRYNEEIAPVVEDLIHQAERDAHIQMEHAPSQKLWSRLGKDYAAMTKLLQHHPNGPLRKLLDSLEIDTYHHFDTILQENIPSHLYDLHTGEKRHTLLRLGAPVIQEYINHAAVSEEFKALINNYSQGAIPRKHLLINLQDRTTWREHARCHVLEQLQSQPGFENALTVVTLATDTEFYHQTNPYHQSTHASIFMEQFKEHLLDENSGYYFPPSVSKVELACFIDGAFPLIHQLFFSSKNVLPREQRLEFIEIFYLFLQLKLIEWIQPNSISLTCKDAIDTGPAYAAELFGFLKFINDQKWTDQDWQNLNTMIYTPALLIRERVMLSERFNRLLGTLKVIENAKDEFGEENFAKVIQEGFALLYTTPILHAQLHWPSR